MAVEQVNLSLTPKMARFLRAKVRGGEYSDIGDVVIAAIRLMEQDEARESRVAGSAVDDILEKLSDQDQKAIHRRVRAGIASIESGDYREYVGRKGLRRLAADVKTRGRKLLRQKAAGE